MFQLVKVLLGRSAQALDRPFSYYYEGEEKLKPLTRVLVDFHGSKDAVGFIVGEPVIKECTVEEYSKSIGFKLGPIKSVLDKEPLLTSRLDSLAKRVADRYLCPLISVYQTMLPPSLRPKDSSLNGPKEKIVRFAVAKPFDPAKLNSNQIKLYQKIRNQTEGQKALASLTSTKTFKSLLEIGAVEIQERRIDRIPERKEQVIEADPTKEQKQAINAILSSEKTTILLEGVTGSGKTLVYLKLAEQMAKENKGTIVLVPEIALTDRTAALFKGLFHDRVAILHSELTPANRYDEYLRIREGKALVVVGTRSAVFAPVHNLGLICIDEEHSDTYKQDSTPFYDARYVAHMRTEIEGAKLVLGSATPLVEDRARAEKNVYGYVTLPNKVAVSQKIDFKFVDMTDLDNLSLKSPLLSNTLLEALKGAVESQEQAILFLNRRGYSPMVQCRKCQKVLTCAACETPYTLHLREGLLRCHRCDAVLLFEKAECPKCHKHDFVTLGFGTERVQKDLENLIPGIRVGRLDQDALSEKKKLAILKEFREHDLDVLVGTSMVAKGHDFPKVTLAAALSADQSLAFPSYLAGETTFDLICQLVGRAGRSDLPGKSIIQTYNPFNKVLQLAARQDYETFYKEELSNRKRFLYPPYCFLTEVVISGTDIKKVLDRCYAVKTFLGAKLEGKRANIYGPADCAIAMIANRHFKKVMIKYKDPKAALPVFKELKETFAPENEVTMTIDIDSRGD